MLHLLHLPFDLTHTPNEIPLLPNPCLIDHCPKDQNNNKFVRITTIFLTIVGASLLNCRDQGMGRDTLASFDSRRTTNTPFVLYPFSGIKYFYYVVGGLWTGRDQKR